MKVKLIAITPNPEEVIEQAGRTCYKSKIGDPTIIQRWIKSGHNSVIEHALVTFRISQVSRSFTHQLVRHRIGSYSQQSQRYCDASNFDYIVPDSILNSSDGSALELYDSFMDNVRSMYTLFLSKGIKKEDARQILPNATHTEIVASYNFSSLRNLFKLRLDKHAQEEFRQVANRMLAIVKPIAPNVFFDIEEITIC